MQNGTKLHNATRYTVTRHNTKHFNTKQSHTIEKYMMQHDATQIGALYEVRNKEI